jgi:hypothetical protein
MNDPENGFRFVCMMHPFGQEGRIEQERDKPS